jgi:hypothetical protein
MTATTSTNPPSYRTGGESNTVQHLLHPGNVPFMLASLFTDDFVRNILNCTRVENVSLCLVVVPSLSTERAEIQSTTVLKHLLSAANERFATGLMCLILSNQGTLILTESAHGLKDHQTLWQKVTMHRHGWGIVAAWISARERDSVSSTKYFSRT